MKSHAPDADGAHAWPAAAADVLARDAAPRATTAPTAAELVRRAARGDVSAFEILMQPHLAALYRLAAAMVGPDEARDVAQETLVSAWRELGHLKRPERLESWLRSILMNRARNVLRARRRHPSIQFDSDAGHGDRLRHEPIDAVTGRWALDDALGKLNPDDRAVIVLRYLADLPMRQVAATLGLREGTAKSRLHAALRALRQGRLEDLR